MKNRFINELKKRIIVLDGGMGTMIQRYGLTEQDYRGNEFVDISGDLKGDNDLLCVTRPDIIRDIHLQYLEAGADIITTNTFNANSISQEDYGMQRFVQKINLAAAQLCRNLVDEFNKTHSNRTIFIAGSIGPTNKTASMSPDVSDPAFRSVTYLDLYKAYKEQIEALVDGGVDLLLFETTFDTLNAKAGLEAANDVLEEKKKDLPVMLSLTLSAQGGRTFSGQTIQAFLASVQHARIVSVGLNCSFGAADMKPYLAELAQSAPFYISAYPNAGLPNTFGGYDETPEMMAAHVRPFVEEGLVNILGGCCGTTPDHIAKFPEIVKNATVRIPVQRKDSLILSGLDVLEVRPENNFVNIGERCNVAGSRKFLRLIKDKKYEEALSIARKQVEDGAQIIDINMDDGLLDATSEMTTFLNLIASEPDIARVPVMIDSSKWEVIEQGLMCVQGKSIVNSISLKEGEELFLSHAKRIRHLGAAAVVMAFDENGQADTYQRKIEVCERAYHLLCDKADFNPQDIIFDPNVLAIATGIEEHNGYALDFIRAVEWIKKHLPGARVSGGISNLSFAFRGNNYVREAMHSVFLYHAIRKGLDMGIVNPSTSVLYEDIEPRFRNLLEDVILCRRPEAAEELITYAQELHVESKGEQTKQEEWRNLPLNERIEYALIKGIGDYLKEDLHEALRYYPHAVDIIDGPLMGGMNRVGDLFGAGKMFLPQVVKTARTMKKAVAILQPVIEAEKSASGSSKAGKVLFATVKGDVHDIGKNIVSIVLACNNYEVIDLGVMVPADVIVKAAIEKQPDFVCLSGLITPSLEEMAHVASEMQKAGLQIPIMVGGATTSKLHTALKIAPNYDYPVIHVTDASQNPLIAARYLNPATRKTFVEQLEKEYEELRLSVGSSVHSLVPLKTARDKKVKINWSTYQPVVPQNGLGVHYLPNIPIEEVTPYINWVYFFNAWKLNGRFADIARIHGCDACRASWLANFPETDRAKAAEAMQLFKEANRMLDRLIEQKAEYCRALYGFYPANSDGKETVNIGGVDWPFLRQQEQKSTGVYKCLADYIMPASEGRTDYIGLFAVTGGADSDYLRTKYEYEGDSYNAMLLQTLTDRLAEATAEYLHQKIRCEYWGYAPEEHLSLSELFKSNYKGIRPAVGYPSLPDQSETFLLKKLLPLEQIGITLTENGAMLPTAAICGLYIAHPESDYFMIGKVDKEQIQKYAQTRNLSEEDIHKMLSRNL